MNVVKLVKVLHDAEQLAADIKLALVDFSKDDTIEQAVKDEVLRKHVAAVVADAKRLVADLES